ncbi:MAG: response regulator transcription factor [Sphingomonadaceae bacterium]
MASTLHEAGYSVTIADDGLAACKLAAEEHPSAIIVDQLTTMLSIFDLCRAIRDHAPPGQCGLVAVLHSDTETMRVGALEAGCDSYIVAPVAPAQLLSVISRLQASPAVGPRSVQFCYGGLELDPSRVRVRFEGRPFSLRHRSFQLLEIFLQFPETPLTRQQLLDETGWPVGAEADRAIDVQVSLLRRQLERVGAAGLIRTVRGIGYMLMNADRDAGGESAKASSI